MDVMEGLVIALFLVILAVFGLLVLQHLLAKKARLTEEHKKSIDKSVINYKTPFIRLIGGRGIPTAIIKGKIAILPKFTKSPPTTLIRITTGWWLFKTVRYLKVLEEEHLDIAEGKPLVIATTSFLPLGNTGFEITPNYPIGVAVKDHGDQTLPYAMRQAIDAYGAMAEKLIELNLTHQENMERGGGLVKMMSNVKDTVLGAIPKQNKQR